VQITVDWLRQGDVWTFENARNPMSYVFSHKVAPGVDVRATLCETTYIGHRVS
jgi:hypothetical protein